MKHLAEILPAHKQLARHLKDRIRELQLHVGERFPTARSLAGEFDVSLTTAQKAFHELANEGWIEPERGRGTFVRRAPPPPAIAKPVGLWPGNPDDPLKGDTYRSHILVGIHAELAKYQGALQLISADLRSGGLSRLEGMIQDRLAELSGMISFPIYGEARFLEFLDRIRIPWVTINQFDHLSRFNYVTSDFYGGSLLAADHLVAGGCHSFWIFENSIRAYSATLRLRGFQDGLLRNGLANAKMQIEDTEDFHETAGFECAMKCLKRYDPPDAIFCGGDLLAFGAMRACQEFGLKVPGDVAVIGYTGLDAANYSSPPLTVVALPMEDIGRGVVQMLVQLKATGQKHLPGVTLAPRLIVRGSTKVPQSRKSKVTGGQK
ncbi:MAG: GntR family transcriptional regulator [Verrucomicrobia bacterium]|nr:GntR family transcriptional regulator [Verrucomicrobiota bacterium]